MKHLKKFEIFNESESFGKLLGSIARGVNKMKWLIGKTGNDEDLAKEILDYLSKLPTDYIKSNDFNKDRVYRPIESNYVFFGKMFKGDAQTEYRVDVIMASDPSIGLHDNPYRVIISKIVSKNTYTPLSRYKSGSGNKQITLLTANPVDNEKMTQLDCSQVIGKKIFEKCKEIYNKTVPNTKGDARGSQNTTSPSKGRFKGFTW
jgi:hypothetical protein